MACAWGNVLDDETQLFVSLVSVVNVFYVLKHFHPVGTTWSLSVSTHLDSSCVAQYKDANVIGWRDFCRYNLRRVHFFSVSLFQIIIS